MKLCVVKGRSNKSKRTNVASEIISEEVVQNQTRTDSDDVQTFDRMNSFER